MGLFLYPERDTMRKTMNDGEAAYRAIALWTNAVTDDVVHKVIVGPYSKPGIAKGSLSQEISQPWGPFGKYEHDVLNGTLLFDRWVEEASTTWKRL